MKTIREWKELKAPIHFTSTSVTLTTIVIDFRRCPSFKCRLEALLRTIHTPYRLGRQLSKEYTLWTDLLHTPTHKLRWMADHLLLWPVYCLIALVKGSARGATWTRSDKATE